MARDGGDTPAETHADLDRIRRLATDLAATDSGPAGELACALADAVLGIADRVHALWQLIAAGAGGAGAGGAGAGGAGAGQKPAGP
jgi:hypothetical protein